MSVKEEYIEVLKKIDVLYRSGKGDTAEADDLNQIADGLWMSLTKEEKREVEDRIDKGTL